MNSLSFFRSLFRTAVLVGACAPVCSFAVDLGQHFDPFGGQPGYVSALVSSDDVVYAASGGHVYRFSYNSVFWERLDAGLPANVAIITLDSAMGEVVVGTSQGVYRLVNGSWTAINTGLTNMSVESLAFDAAGNLFAGTAGGAFKLGSSLTGAWSRLGPVASPGWVKAITVDASGTVYVSTLVNALNGSGSFFRLVQNGASWQEVKVGLPSNMIIEGLAVDSAGVVTARGYLVPGPVLQVFRLGSGATAWVGATAGLPTNDISAGEDSLSFGQYGLLLAAGANGVYRYDTAGNRWSAAATFSGATALTVAQEYYAYVGAGVVYMSDNSGAAWTLLGNGLTSGLVPALAVDGGGNVLAANGGDRFRGAPNPGIFQVAPGATQWSALTAGLPTAANLTFGVMVTDPSGGVYASWINGGVFYRANGSAVWTARSTGLGGHPVYSFAFDGAGRPYAGTDDGVYRYSGTYWTRLATTGGATGPLRALAFDLYDNLYMGTSGLGVYRLPTGTLGWIAVPGLPNGAVVNALQFDALGMLYAGVDNAGVYALSVGGAGFVATGLNSLTLDLAASPDGEIFAATQSGLWRRPGAGAAWTQPADAPTGRVLALAFNPVGELFVGTDDEGVFQGNFSVTFDPLRQTIVSDSFDGTSFSNLWVNDRWTISGGSAHNVDYANDTLQTAQSYPQANFEIESTANGFDYGYFRSFNLVFGRADLAVSNYYSVKWFSESPGRGNFRLDRSEGNEFFPVILATAPYQLDRLKNYTIRVRHTSEGRIQVFVGQGSAVATTPIIDVLDTTYPTLGHFGWQLLSETYWEEFSVESIVASAIQDQLIRGIAATSTRAYELSTLAVGTRQYTDRAYTLTAIPEFLRGVPFIRTANDDKASTAANLLSFTLAKDSTLYVAFDPRATVLPAWLNGWSKTALRIGTSDPGSSMMDVYSRYAPAGTVTLGGALAPPGAGAAMAYLVFATPGVQPGSAVEAETAALQGGAIVSSSNPGYLGTGFVDFVNASGESLSFTANEFTAGTYRLSIRYALGSGTGREMELWVNGVLTNAHVLFSPTAGWASWSSLQLSIPLKAGPTRFRFGLTDKAAPTSTN